MRKKLIYLFAILVFISSIPAFSSPQKEFNVERLPLGNAKYKYDFAAVKSNQIYEAQTNQHISFEQFINSLKKYRIVLVGETHTNDLHHQIQLRIIKGLVESGSVVCLALEMFERQKQEILDNYTAGKINEREFLDQTNWFVKWTHNYRYYKPIFDYARDNKIKMYAINIPRKYVSAMRTGMQKLSDKEKEAIPQVSTSSIEHQFLIKYFFEGLDALEPKLFQGFYLAQSTWDAAMAEGAIKTAKENPRAIVVVMAGSGHVMYNLGIARIITERSGFSVASVLAVDVPEETTISPMMEIKKGAKKEKGDKTLDKSSGKKKEESPAHRPTRTQEGLISYKIVSRGLADFLFGVPDWKEKPIYPSLGFSTDEKSEKTGGFRISRVFPETIAREKGFGVGDVILTVDGRTLESKAELYEYLCYKNWNDDISFEILSKGEKIQLEFKLVYKKHH
ncbi:MAG: ChaN family lipoprotein [Candidatus Aminicenantia bacterium]